MGQEKQGKAVSNFTWQVWAKRWTNERVHEVASNPKSNKGQETGEPWFPTSWKKETSKEK